MIDYILLNEYLKLKFFPISSQFDLIGASKKEKNLDTNDIIDRVAN